jgi:hypothetical protein
MIYVNSYAHSKLIHGGWQYAVGVYGLTDISTGFSSNSVLRLVTRRRKPPSGYREKAISNNLSEEDS